MRHYTDKDRELFLSVISAKKFMPSKKIIEAVNEKAGNKYALGSARNYLGTLCRNGYIIGKQCRGYKLAPKPELKPEPEPEDNTLKEKIDDMMLVLDGMRRNYQNMNIKVDDLRSKFFELSQGQGQRLVPKDSLDALERDRIELNLLKQYTTKKTFNPFRR